MATNESIITIVYGEETFFPEPYNNFKVGPYTYTTTIQDGETVKQALLRAYKELDEAANQLFLRKRNAYAERLRSVKL